jgi:hypothetical protein
MEKFKSRLAGCYLMGPGREYDQNILAILPSLLGNKITNV